jgi:23S rRNA G2069 N7-methylase RlmK/C1962 C5-methylase RlmI
MVEQRAQMLINRVRKNQRSLKAWRKRESVQCYRLYDRDIPELPLAIDWYDGALHASVYQRKRPLEHAEAQSLVLAVGESLGLESKDCFLKHRERQKGEAQYQALDGGAPTRTVDEGELKFEVNLSDYLDTGLFLDHRPARRWVGEAAPDKRLLNLFSYTGGFSVHAACAGASETVSVDLSKTYLDWAGRNLKLNGQRVGIRNQLLRADALTYIPEAPHDYFDLVVLDPPTFSNSKSMDQTLDIQRDHLAMLRGLMPCLRDGGQIFFSTNNRRFELDGSLASDWRIEDRSERSIPPDFRDRRVHKLWVLERR